MANWVAISIDNLNNAKIAALVDALRTSALEVGQTERSAEIIEGVVNRIRAEVKGCATNQLDSDETKIPKDLKDLAVRMILRALKSAVEEPLMEDERADRDADERYLIRVSKCEVPIATPDDPIAGEVQAGGSVEIVSEPTRTVTRDTLKGL
jgi:hypothetical protein